MVQAAPRQARRGAVDGGSPLLVQLVKGLQMVPLQWVGERVLLARLREELGGLPVERAGVGETGGGQAREDGEPRSAHATRRSVGTIGDDSYRAREPRAIFCDESRVCIRFRV